MTYLGRVSTETMAKDFGSPFDGQKALNSRGVLAELADDPVVVDDTIENPN